MQTSIKLEKSVYSLDDIEHILTTSGENEWLANVVFLDSNTLFLMHQGKPEFKYDKSQIQKMFELQRLTALKAQEQRKMTLNKQLDSQEGLKGKFEDSDSKLWITIDTDPNEDGASKAYVIARSLQEVGLENRYDQIVYGPKAFVNCHRLKQNLPRESESALSSTEPEVEQKPSTGFTATESGEKPSSFTFGAEATAGAQVYTAPKEASSPSPLLLAPNSTVIYSSRPDARFISQSETNVFGDGIPLLDKEGEREDEGEDVDEKDMSADSIPEQPRDLLPLSSVYDFPRDFLFWLFSAGFPTSLLESFSLLKLDNHRKAIPPLPSLVKLINATFLCTYRFDGYDPISNKITSADGKTTSYTGTKLPFWLMLASFLGLPSRAESVVDGVPQFSGWQLLKNLFGVWISVKETLTNKEGDRSFYQYRWTEKKIVQGIFLLFKLVIIFPLKLILMPFKIMLNIIKLVTEVFIPMITYYTSMINAKLFLGLIKYSFQRTENKFFIGTLIFFGMIPLMAMAIIQYAIVWACRIGFAFTSPEMSARYAFALGYSLSIGKKGSLGQRFISNIMGGIGAIVSLTLSGVLWTIALPLTLSALVTAIPSLLTAVTWISQLPFVATSLAWLSQWPLLTKLSVLLNSAVSTVGGGLAIAFGPIITPLATAMGLQISAAIMTAGTVLGMIAIPVAAILSRVADELSNLWASWVEQKPFATLVRGISTRGKQSSDTTKQNTPPERVFVYQATPGGEYIVSPKVLHLENNRKESLSALEVSGDAAEALYLRAKENEQYHSNEGARFATDTEFNAPHNSPAAVI